MPKLPSPTNVSPGARVGGWLRFIGGERGNVAAIFALMVPVLVLALGGGLTTFPRRGGKTR